MKNSVCRSDFVDAFIKMNHGDTFSCLGLSALFDYFEEYEESCDCEIELDVIAICCEFTEYADLEEIQKNYTDISSLEDLHDHTTVIEFSGGIIIQDY